MTSISPIRSAKDHEDSFPRSSICECPSSGKMQKSKAKSLILRTDVRSSHHRPDLVETVKFKTPYMTLLSIGWWTRLIQSGGIQDTRQTFQVPLHLAPTSRGEASSVTTGGMLNHQLMWLYLGISIIH